MRVVGRSLASALSLCAVFATTQALATVVQVDGTIVPANNNQQGDVNTEEGVAPPQALAIT